MKTNYAIDVGFSIESEKPFEDITARELCDAMQRRLDELKKEGDYAIEAFGCWDAYEIGEEKQ